MGYRCTEIVRGLNSPDRSSGYWLVLTVLSTYANDQNGLCWPSLEKIAMGSKLSVKMARRHVQQLQLDGQITVVSNPAGGRPGATPTYKLNFVDGEVINRTPVSGSKHSATPIPFVSPAAPERPPVDGSRIRMEPALNQSELTASNWQTTPLVEWSNGDYVACGHANNISLIGQSFDEFKQKIQRNHAQICHQKEKSKNT